MSRHATSADDPPRPVTPSPVLDRVERLLADRERHRVVIERRSSDFVATFERRTQLGNVEYGRGAGPTVVDALDQATRSVERQRVVERRRVERTT